MRALGPGIFNPCSLLLVFEHMIITFWRHLTTGLVTRSLARISARPSHASDYKAALKIRQEELLAKHGLPLNEHNIQTYIIQSRGFGPFKAYHDEGRCRISRQSNSCPEVCWKDSANW